MFVLGLGLGLVMQVLVLAVQNAVDYSELGVATSGATLFRSIGGSFGASVLGAIFASQLPDNLASRRSRDSRPPAAASFDPAALAQLPPAVHDAYVQAFTDSLNVVFLVAAAIGVAAFALTWFIKELPLRDTVATAGVGEAFAVPRTPIRSPSSPASSASSPAASRQTASSSASPSAPGSTCTGRDLAARTLQPRPRPRRPRARRRPTRSTRSGSTTHSARSSTPALIEGSGDAHRRGHGDARHADQLRPRPARRARDGWQPEQHPELRELIQGLARQFIDTPVGQGISKSPPPEQVHLE